MTKKTSLLFSLLCCAPLSLRAMDTQQWLKDKKAQKEESRQKVLTKGLERIERSVDKHTIANPAPLACLNEYTRSIDRLIATQPTNRSLSESIENEASITKSEHFLPLQRVVTKIETFLRSPELKELAGPVPHGWDDPTELELYALYLQKFPSLLEMYPIEQELLPENDPLIRALKLGSRIIHLRKEACTRHRLELNPHYVDLIKKAYAYLETK